MGHFAGGDLDGDTLLEGGGHLHAGNLLGHN